MPPLDMNWPPAVRTHFPALGHTFALTVDDGWTGASIEPFMVFAASNNLVPFTWFANGVGIRRIRESESAMAVLMERGLEIGYHTMTHPAVEDQRRNYNRARWLDDYDEWKALALETVGDRSYKVKPYARAAGGYFSTPFLEMCDERGLLPIGWSKDPYVLVRGEEIGPGDIFLTHFRYSEWRWFEHVRELRNQKLLWPGTVSALLETERRYGWKLR